MKGKQKLICEILDAFRGLCITHISWKGLAISRKQQIHFLNSDCRIEIYAGMWRFAESNEFDTGKKYIFDTGSEGVELLVTKLAGKKIASIALSKKWQDLNIVFSCRSVFEVKAFTKTSDVPVWRLLSGPGNLLLGCSEDSFELVAASKV